MTEPVAFPVEGQAFPDDNWADWYAQDHVSGVTDGLGSTGLQAYTTASGLFVRPGTAKIRGVTYRLPAARPVAVPTNTTSAVRFDRLVLRHNLATNQFPFLQYITGGAAAPTITRTATTYDMRIALLTVQPGGAIPSAVSDDRDYAGMDVVPTVAANDVALDPTRRRTGMVAAGAWGASLWTGSAARPFMFTDQEKTARALRTTGGQASGIVDSVIITADTPSVPYSGFVSITGRVRMALSGPADYYVILRQTGISASTGSLAAGTTIDIDLDEVRTNGGTGRVNAIVDLDAAGDRYRISMHITRVGGTGTATVVADRKQTRLDMLVTPGVPPLNAG